MEERELDMKWEDKLSFRYLKGKGISKIDTLILSHADSDHVEGAEEILKEIRVRRNSCNAFSL